MNETTLQVDVQGQAVRSYQEQLTPMGMLEKALASGAGIDVLERLMALSERWQVNQAQRAFSEALSAARGTMPFITKNNQVSFGAGKTQYKYEDLAEVIEKVTPSLSQNGLSFRWRTDSDTPGYVTVTCILSHRDGHSEENSLSGPYDVSGNKNPIQAIGSVVTYLQRYTLKASLGVAAGHDDDGRQGEPTKPPHSNTSGEDLCTQGQQDLIKSLGRSPLITDEERQKLEDQVNNGLSKKQASEIIERLKAMMDARRKQNQTEQAQAGNEKNAIGHDNAQKFIEYAKGKGWAIPHLQNASMKHFNCMLHELTREEADKLKAHMIESYAKPAPEDFSDVEVKEPPHQGEQEPPMDFGELSGPDPNAPPVEPKGNKAQRARIMLGLKTAIKKADMPESELKECIAEWFGTPMATEEHLEVVLQRLTIEQMEEMKQHLTAPVTV